MTAIATTPLSKFQFFPVRCSCLHRPRYSVFFSTALSWQNPLMYSKRIKSVYMYRSLRATAKQSHYRDCFRLVPLQWQASLCVYHRPFWTKKGGCVFSMFFTTPSLDYLFGRSLTMEPARLNQPWDIFATTRRPPYPRQRGTVASWVKWAFCGHIQHSQICTRQLWYTVISRKLTLTQISCLSPLLEEETFLFIPLRRGLGEKKFTLKTLAFVLHTLPW